MLIRVMYKNGRYDQVKGFILDKLIESERVVKFYRSGRWAIIGHDKLRGTGGINLGYHRRYYEY
ncbi:MAG: hypothetical protein FIA94_12730 [Nitrospirae bacterium]|nr:hypothetical protein [Nitrospirota bacterium]